MVDVAGPGSPAELPMSAVGWLSLLTVGQQRFPADKCRVSVSATPLSPSSDADRRCAGRYAPPGWCRPACESSPRPFCLRGRLRSPAASRSEEHTSELQSLMRISYAVF